MQQQVYTLEEYLLPRNLCIEKIALDDEDESLARNLAEITITDNEFICFCDYYEDVIIVVKKDLESLRLAMQLLPKNFSIKIKREEDIFFILFLDKNNYQERLGNPEKSWLSQEFKTWFDTKHH